MNATLFSQLVSQVSTGKHLPDAIYLHRDAFSALPDKLAVFIPAVAKAVRLDDDNWNLVKLFKKEFRLSLLHYPEFYTDSYPALKQSMNVDLSRLSHKITRYEGSDNPPILHRKETMVLPENDYYEHFISLTQEGENAGLYQNSRLIGFKRSWENLIGRHGYELVDGRLFRSSAVTTVDTELVIASPTAIIKNRIVAIEKAMFYQGFHWG